MSTEHQEQFAASQPPMDMAMIQEAHAQQRSLVGAGREQAAAWHDARALECDKYRAELIERDSELLANSALAMGQWHRSAAASIRKLSDYVETLTPEQVRAEMGVMSTEEYRRTWGADPVREKR